MKVATLLDKPYARVSAHINEAHSVPCLCYTAHARKHTQKHVVEW